MIVGKVYLHYV